MTVPIIVSLKVVEYQGKKMLLVPNGFLKNENDPMDYSIATNEGLLKFSVWVNRFHSFDDLGRESDSACLLFRKGEFEDCGRLSYFGGQDSGYLTWGGFRHVKTENPRDAHQIHASWFEIGDIISFVMMPRK